MSENYTYPGVYIREEVIGPPTISGVATSIAAFIGYAKKDERKDISVPVRIFTFSKYQELFGNSTKDSDLAKSVELFFANGGNECYIVNVRKPEGARAIAYYGLTEVSIPNGENGGDGQPIERGPASKLGVPTILKKPEKSSKAENPKKSTNPTDKKNPSSKKTTATRTRSTGDSTAENTDSYFLVFRAREYGESGNYYKIEIKDFPNGKINFDIQIKIYEEGPEITEDSIPIVDYMHYNCSVENIQEKFSNEDKFIECLPFQLKEDATDSSPNAENLEQFDQIETEKLSLLIPDKSEVDQPKSFAGGVENPLPNAAHYIQAIETLNRVDLFNLMIIAKINNYDPNESNNDSGTDSSSDTDSNGNSNGNNSNNDIMRVKMTTDSYVEILQKAVVYCKNKRAFLLIDPPKSWYPANPARDPTSSVISPTNIAEVRKISPNNQCAVYYPFIIVNDFDPVKKESYKREIGPAAAIAGLMARIDSRRGIWKAPAGVEATINGIDELHANLTDNENGVLNKQGVNCLRYYQSRPICWGARTVAGSDDASPWKYIPVRRLTLFIEESLYRGTHWIVFEPNDEPLWAKIRASINAFMLNLYKKGAFQGKPSEAFYVRCDKETTTPDHQEQGIVNIIVGFAPVKPAEFVVITIQRIMGKIT